MVKSRCAVSSRSGSRHSREVAAGRLPAPPAAPEAGDFEGAAAADDHHGVEFLRPADRVGFEEGREFVQRHVGREIDVGQGAAEQQIPHGAADDDGETPARLDFPENLESLGEHG